MEIGHMPIFLIFIVKLNKVKLFINLLTALIFMSNLANNVVYQSQYNVLSIDNPNYFQIFPI